MSLFWMSFADPDLPEDEQFLGALVVEAESLAAAITASHLQGLNPGGEIASLEVPEEAVPPAWRNRLLSREDIEAFDAEEPVH